MDLDAALERVEARYRAAGLPPSFHISEAAQPPGLDVLLAARGYTLEAPTLVMAASPIAVVAATAPAPVAQSSGTHSPVSPEVRVAATPDGAWTDLWWSVDGRGDAHDRAVALQILQASPALYATVPGPHAALAVGRLALAGPWAGLYCLAVDPGARGTGLGTAVVHALAVAGQARGASALWLQVVEANAAARRLYERHGFRTVGRYHYRTGPVRPGPGLARRRLATRAR